MKKTNHFGVQTVERCIYLNDLRGKLKSIHFTKGQAIRVGKALMDAGEKADYGKGQNLLI